MKKLSLTLLLALIIGIAYFSFLSKYFFGFTIDGLENGDVPEFFGAAIANALVAPHILLGWIAVILNLVAFLANNRGCALATVILYAVSAVSFFMYALFVVPEILLSIIGYVRLRKIKAHNAEVEIRRKAAKAV